MIGGPETDLARGITDVPVTTSTTGGAPAIPPPQEGAVPQGNMFSAPSPDAFTIPGQSKSQQLQMGPAQYAWQPGQEGFGQGDVQRYGFDTGMVPVAEMKLPFGALASRGQALAERKQQNQQAQKALIEKFDPYGGVGKAADPFQPAFGKYARGQIDKLAADIAAAYGGDIGEAYRRMATPGTEEYMLLKNRSQELQDIATENRFVYGQFADILALDVAGERTLDPDIKQDIIRFLSALDENGVPVEGADPSEFRTKRRDLEARISMSQFIKDIASDILKIVQSEAQKIGKAIPLPGGNYMLEDISEKDMEPAVRQYAKMYAQMSMGKVTEQQAYEELRPIFNNELKRQIRTFKRENPGGGNEGGRPKSGIVLSSTYGPVEGLSSTGQFNQVRVNKITSGAGGFMPPSPFLGAAGEAVTIHPIAVFENERGEKMISGKLGADPRSRVKAAPKDDGMSFDFSILDETTGEWKPTDEATYFQNLPTQILPYEGANEAAWEQATGQTRQQVDKALRESEAKRKARDDEFTRTASGKSAEPTKSAMVVVKLPDGRTGQIPSDKLADFKKKYHGATEVK